MPESKTKSLIDVSLLIVGSTALLYFCAYKFESNEYDYYKIPGYLIDVSIYMVLKFSVECIIGLILIPMTMFWIYRNLVFTFKVSKDLSLSFITIILFINLFILLVFGIFFSDYLINGKTFRSIILAFNTLLGIGIFIFKKKGVKSKEIAVELNDINEVHTPIFILYLFVSFALFSIAFSGIEGKLSAKNREYFYVTGKKQNIVILAKNSEYLIAKPFSTKTHILSDSLIIYKISDSQPFIIELKHIGRIKK